jgi:hypothetical protein
MTIRELLAVYYKGLARKTGWEAVLADDFRFIGGNMTKQTPVVGKDNYVATIQRLSQVFSEVRVVKSFVDGDEAFVLASYDWTFPHAVNIQGSVAELWKAKNGKLQELTIFFDTGSFDRLAKG